MNLHNKETSTISAPTCPHIRPCTGTLPIDWVLVGQPNVAGDWWRAARRGTHHFSHKQSCDMTSCELPGMYFKLYISTPIVKVEVHALL